MWSVSCTIVIFEYWSDRIEILQKILILSVVIGMCVAATVVAPKLDEVKKEAVVEDLQTAETNARQFGHGGMWSCSVFN